MRYLFLPGADLTQSTLTIDGPDAHHLLNVLRIRPGETLTLLDNAGQAALSETAVAGKRSIVLRLLHEITCPPDPQVHITVAQALGKGDKFEQVVQHATEVGVSAFVPLLTDRTVVKIESRDVASKLARWLAIAKGAAEQAGRGRIPTIVPPISLRDLCARFPDYGRVLLLHPAADCGSVGVWPMGRNSRSHTPTLPHSHTLLLVGPEGGFSPGELEMAGGAGARRTSLGPFTLRTETAALVAVTRILYEVERG